MIYISAPGDSLRTKNAIQASCQPKQIFFFFLLIKHFSGLSLGYATALMTKAYQGVTGHLISALSNKNNVALTSMAREVEQIRNCVLFHLYRVHLCWECVKDRLELPYKLGIIYSLLSIYQKSYKFSVQFLHFPLLFFLEHNLAQLNQHSICHT